MPELIVKRLTVGLLEENCYLLGCLQTKQAILIDPGDSARAILAEVEKDELTLVAILNTHAHFDHVMAVNAIVDATGVPFYLHPKDVPTLERCVDHVYSWLGVRIDPVYTPDHFLEEGQILAFGSICLEVRFVPGHSPGHVAFIEHDRQLALVGDTLFQQSIGRYDLPGANGPELVASIRAQLLTLKDEFAVLPGHGDETRIGIEKLSNPYVGQNAYLPIG